MEPDRENMENRIGIHPLTCSLKTNTNTDVHIGVFIEYEFK
jgi:hypothetical protein